MAFLSLLLILALSQHFARGYLPFAADDANKYFKVPIPWGLHMYSGVVQVVCESASMSSVCWYNGKDSENKAAYDLNLFPCLTTYRDNGVDAITAMNAMAKLFEGPNSNCVKDTTPSPTTCPQLFGIFTSQDSSDYGDYGIVNGKIEGKKAVSEATAENVGQFWALCAVKKR